MPATKTKPPRVATPITDAKPTAAEMLKGVCETSRASTPPATPKGSTESTANALRMELNERRSEEHTSELQSHSDLVCRLLLEKKKKKRMTKTSSSTTQKDEPRR